MSVPVRARHNVKWWQSWGGCPGRWAWAWRWAHGAVCARTCWSAAVPAPACLDSAWWGSWKVASPARTGPPQTVAADSPRGPGSSCGAQQNVQFRFKQTQYCKRKSFTQNVCTTVVKHTNLSRWYTPCGDLSVVIFRWSFQDVYDDGVTGVISKAEHLRAHQGLLDEG